MACEEAGQNEAIPDLAEAIDGAADKFVQAGSIVLKDAVGPKAPSLTVVLRISMLASVMVPLVMASMPKGIGRARGRWTTL